MLGQVVMVAAVAAKGIRRRRRTSDLSYQESQDDTRRRLPERPSDSLGCLALALDLDSASTTSCGAARHLTMCRRLGLSPPCSFLRSRYIAMKRG